MTWRGTVLRLTLCGTLFAAPTIPAAAYDCSETTYQKAKLRMTLAFGTGVLQNDKSGGGISILINDGYWRSMTFPEKQRFADELVCAVAGVGKGLYSLSFRSLSTGKTIAEWSTGILTVR